MTEVIIIIVAIVIVIKAWKVFAGLIILGSFWAVVGCIWLVSHYDLWIFT
jgi:hypothetical protein